MAKSNKQILNNLQNMQNVLDDIFKTTYSSPTATSKDVDAITTDLSRNIDNIIANACGKNSINSMSKIMNRMTDTNSGSASDAIKDILSDLDSSKLGTDIMNFNMENTEISIFDQEVDMILKYMPRLAEALSCLKDCVLSSDHFANEFIRFKTYGSVSDIEKTDRNSALLKEQYKLQELFEDIHDNMSKYGECLLYIVPYNRELSRLLNQKKSSQNTYIRESVIYDQSSDDKELQSNIKEICKSSNIDLNKFNIQLEFSTVGFLESGFNDMNTLNAITDDEIVKPLNEQVTAVINEAKNKKEDEFSYPDELLGKSSNAEIKDGITNMDTSQTLPSHIKVNGCIVKKLKRENVVFLMIENVIFGYLYIESSIQNAPSTFNSGTMKASSNPRYGINSRTNECNKDTLISHISSRLASMVNTRFINANQDLANEIYLVLKHNELFNNMENGVGGNIKMTYIPPDDIEHCYFKKDPKTQRGISDLALSIFPARLYICLYLNDILNKIVRGFDRRVYYVKQNIDTNISQTMMNTIKQIKRGNYGVREFDSINNALNILGRFKDFVIPVNASGESPIQFEVMEGMRTDIDTELYDRLDRMAINPTDVPIEVIDQRQTLDFAIQENMVNAKLMRKSYKRQRIIKDIYSRVVTKIYNYQYNSTISLEVELPPPIFLNVTNINNILQSISQYIESLVELKLRNEDEEIVNEFKKLAIERQISNHINLKEIDSLIETAKMRVTVNKKANDDDE